MLVAGAGSGGGGLTGDDLGAGAAPCVLVAAGFSAGIGFGVGAGGGAKAGFFDGTGDAGGGGAVVVFSGALRGAGGVTAAGGFAGDVLGDVLGDVPGAALGAGSAVDFAGFAVSSIALSTGADTGADAGADAGADTGAGGVVPDSGSGDSRIHNVIPAVAMMAIASRVAGRRIPRRREVRPSSLVMPVSAGQAAGNPCTTHSPSCLPACCTARCRQSYRVHAVAGNRTAFRRAFWRHPFCFLPAFPPHLPFWPRPDF